ncbi:hypothetical protein C3K47_15610 [Solitalea longa]|uniref:Uncharacterized protein n=1 Tax=Solitalea longa TaxID=2079460 RepID=A0A2S4ZYR0_9SPHI|nr:hypothetical protein [Solitalea longa]POY35485.1 hypothetical protein C3K47_15610 [Solitalea longa]
MKDLKPFDIVLTYEGLNYPAQVTPIDEHDLDVTEFEITFEDRKFWVYWVNNTNVESPLVPSDFVPDGQSFRGKEMLYNLIIAELLKVLNDTLM